jgi:DNA-binding transcriptional ArsR family regulator
MMQLASQPQADDKAEGICSRMGIGKGRHQSSVRLSGAFLELVARRLQAVAEPNRIRILQILAEGDATVQEITDQLATTHQNVSRHLAVLYQSGIVGRQKDGTCVCYSLADFTALALIEHASASTAGFVEDLATISQSQATRRVLVEHHFWVRAAPAAG